MNQFIRLTEEMRNAQKKHLKERTRSALSAAKIAEGRVDRWLDDYNSQKALAQALQLFPTQKKV